MGALQNGLLFRMERENTSSSGSSTEQKLSANSTVVVKQSARRRSDQSGLIWFCLSSAETPAQG